MQAMNDQAKGMPINVIVLSREHILAGAFETVPGMKEGCGALKFPPLKCFHFAFLAKDSQGP